MIPLGTVLHNKQFLRAVATTYFFSTSHTIISCAHVFLPFLSTTSTMQRRVDGEFKLYMDCIKQYLISKKHLASDKRMRNVVVRAAKTGHYQVDGD